MIQSAMQATERAAHEAAPVVAGGTSVLMAWHGWQDWPALVTTGYGVVIAAATGVYVVFRALNEIKRYRSKGVEE